MLENMGVYHRKDDFLWDDTLNTIKGCHHSEATAKLQLLKQLAPNELNQVLVERYEEQQYRQKKSNPSEFSRKEYNYYRVLTSVFEDINRDNPNFNLNHKYELKTRLADMVLSKLPSEKRYAISTLSSLFALAYSPVKITANVIYASGTFSFGAGKLALGVANYCRDNGSLFYEGGRDIGTSIKYSIGAVGAILAPAIYPFSKFTTSILCAEPSRKYEHQGELGEVHISYHSQSESDREEVEKAAQDQARFMETHPDFAAFVKSRHEKVELEDCQDDMSWQERQRKESHDRIKAEMDAAWEVEFDRFRRNCKDNTLSHRTPRNEPPKRALLHGNGFIEYLD